MLATIGRKPPPTDAVDLLVECHGRIRDRLALARRLTTAGDRPPAEIAEAAEGVRKYFSSSFLTHVRDEHELVVRLLRGFEPAVDAALAAMEEEHEQHELPIARLIATAGQLASAPERLAALRPELTEIVDTLEALLPPHLAREEELVFPAFRRLLLPERQADVAAEMRRRRGL
jgi:iron-sulfur cluster repair protein YtfE (RIC family)